MHRRYESRSVFLWRNDRRQFSLATEDSRFFHNCLQFFVPREGTDIICEFSIDIKIMRFIAIDKDDRIMIFLRG